MMPQGVVDSLLRSDTMSEFTSANLVLANVSQSNVDVPHLT